MNKNSELNYRNKGVPLITLTKSEIISKVVDANGQAKNRSSEAVEKLIGIIKSTLESGEDVSINGFGRFCVKAKKERKGRNIVTGVELIIDARRVVTFRCSKKLKDRINIKA